MTSDSETPPKSDAGVENGNNTDDYPASTAAIVEENDDETSCKAAEADSETDEKKVADEAIPAKDQKTSEVNEERDDEPPVSDASSAAVEEASKDIESGGSAQKEVCEESTGEGNNSPEGLVEETASSNSSSEDSSTEDSQASDPDSTSRTRTQASGFSQILALVRKNILTKFRTPAATFFELFSPVLMMLVLSAAYTLTDVIDRDAKMYSSINISLPGPWVGLVERTTDLFGTNNNLDLTSAIGRRRKLMQRERDLHEEDPNLLVQMMTDIDDDDEPKTWDGIFEVLVEKLEKIASGHTHGIVSDGMDESHDRRLQQFRYRNDTSSDLEAQSYELLDSALDELRDLLKGPIPTPSFSQFVSFSTALSNVIPLDSLPRVFSESSFGRQWGNLLTLGTLHLSPRNQATEDFWTYLNETYPLTTFATSAPNVSNFLVRIHDDETSALNYIDATIKEERTWALLDFSDFDMEEDSKAYHIRMNYTTVPNVNRITRWASIGLSQRYQRYYLSGYMTLQRTVNEFAMAQSGCDQDVSTIMSMPMPTAAYSQNPFFTQVGYLLGLTMAMAFLYPTSRFIKTLVEEKETKMKETLLILGVRPWAHWMSWFFTSLMVFIVITVSVTFTLSSTVLMHSDPAYLFVYIFLFSTSTIGFCFTVASFFSRAKLAAIIGPIALFATLLPRFIFFGTNRYENVTGQVLASLCPATAFAFGADIIADYEYAEQGIQSYNAGEGGYSFNTSLGMLFFDTILYIFLGWYLEQIIPQQYGVARPFYFLFLPSYWLGECAKKDGENVSIIDDNDDQSPDIEAVNDTSLIPKVQISGLVKQYFKGKTSFPPAVDGLNLTMYESQITALLGHNGAGKTTTVSVLTGLFPPSSGDCVMYGKSIVHNKQEARQSLGICPQHNILFDDLTVFEHLSFFMCIKGLVPETKKILKHAEDIGLTDYLGTTSKALSGGNKRKLSVAIALSGDPDVLILDEPTSAMDPHSRRAVWELLRAKKEGRVTLLTTHFMDEAELLSDRVAVMKEGNLKCCGSPIFLKERFGLGYSMTVVLEPPAMNNDEEGGFAQATENVFLNQRESVLEFLNKRIPNTTIVRTSGKEVTFRFPQGSEAFFPTTFDNIEINKGDLGIGAYGIQNTSLEEVFLHLAESISDEEEAEAVLVEDGDNDIYVGEYSHLSPLGQIGLLYGKRFTIQRRDKKGACFTIILPVLVIALVLVILMLEPPHIGGTLEISPLMFQETSAGKTNAATNIALSDRLPSMPELQAKSEASLAFMEGIHQRYGNTEFTMDTNTHSSMDLSKFLLDTYNSREHSTRFGAYALNDIVNFTITVDGSSTETLVDSTALQNLTSGLDENEIDIIPLFGLGDENGNLKAAINLTNLPAMISTFGLILPNVTLEIPKIAGLVEDSLELMLSGGILTNLSLSKVDDYLNQMYYSPPDIEDPLLVIEEPNQNTSIASINAAGSDNSSNVADGISPAEDGIAGASGSTKVLQIDLIELVGFILSSGPFNRTVLVESIDSLLPDVFESLGLSISATSIPSGSSFLRLLDNVMAELNNLALNETLLEGFLSSDSNLLNNTLLGDINLDAFNILNNTILGGNMAPNQSAIGNIFGTGNTEQLNSTDSEQLSNAIAVAATIILRESLNEAVGTNMTINVSEIFDEFLTSVGYNGSLQSLGLLADDLFDVTIQVSNITLNVPSMMLTIYNLTLTVNEEPPIFLPSAEFYLLDVALENLSPILPEEFVIPINAQISILHNTTSDHAVAAFNQAYMEYVYGKCKGSSSARLKSVNRPLPVTTQQSIEIKTILSIVAALFLLIPYCYIPGAFSVFIVKERISKSKHLQLVSGVNMTSYWFATYLWDMSLFLLLTILTMAVFLSYGNESAAVFVGEVDSFFATAIITFGYGLSILPFSYLLARNFNNPSTAQISVIGLIFVTGFVAVNAYFVMTALEETRDLAKSLLPLFRLWPAFNVGEGFIELSSAYWEREVLFSTKQPFDWEVTGRSIALLYGLAPMYMLILLFLEYSDDGGSGGMAGRVLRYIKGSYNKIMLAAHGVRKVGNKLTLDDGLAELVPNEDVQQEVQFVNANENQHQTSPIVLRDLWKVFPPSIGLLGGLSKHLNWLLCCCGLCKRSTNKESDGDKSGPRRAVRGLTTAVQRGETFGLLGANGAGKTTTLGMLTGDIAATAGEAYVAGHDITGATPGGVQEARKNIGFCPQIDPLLGLMTGRETLRMFARLRGISADKIEEVVTALLDKLTLTPHADKTADSYSGGNKRKLSLGIAALVADGGVLLIDECSSGLDPLARKKLWGLIEKLALERSVVITTHSMEEAEALCSRIGIMAHGQFVALGTVQHLKTKHLDGYTVDISCIPNLSQSTIDSIVEEICTQVIPGSVVSERYGRFLKFEVNKVSTIGLGTTFKRLQELKESRGIIENYSIAQCSLEQVFIKLVKEAEEAHHSTTVAST